MQVSRSIAPCLLMVLALAGCRTARDVMNAQEANVSYGRYAEAAAEPGKLADEGGRDALCWELHAATAEHLSARHEEAIRRFDRAEDRFADFDSRGPAERYGTGAWSMMTGDYVLPYAGSGQDRIFTCLYKAIDFGVLGDAAAVRTELNRAMQHQANWRDERAAEIAASDEKMKRDAQDYAKSQGTVTNNTTSAGYDALANSSFASTVRQRTQFDMAKDGRLETLEADDYTNAYLVRVNEVFRRFVGDTGARPRDRVAVFVEDGLCPRRREWRVDLPLILIPGVSRYVPYAGIALPELVYRHQAATAYSVAAGGTNVTMPSLQDVDRLVKTEFDVYFRGAMVREITRALLRVGVQAALGVASQSLRHSRDSQNAAALLQLAQLGFAAWSFYATEADIRSWTTLPKRVYAVELARPADGVVTVDCGTERVKVNVPSGNAMVFVRKTSSAAPAVVKSFVLPN